MSWRRVGTWSLGAALCVAGAGSLWSCRNMSGAAPVDQSALAAQNSVFFQEQLRLAREALARQEWEAARQNLEGVVESLPATDPNGAEARAGLAQIAFELGDYARAAQVAAEVPNNSAVAASALESRGLAQLFSCNFEAATQTFYQLAEVDNPRGRVWLGVAFAWTGADANAERELSSVVSSAGNTEHAPNARFYLSQLALWGRRAGPAQRYMGELQSSSPQYLPTLDTRAQNWLTRRAHLMRAYFTFDTLARLHRMSSNNQAVADDQHAGQALALLQASPGACGEQVTRLAQARSAAAGDRDAFAAANRDNDGDGVPDARDRCPNEAETRNGIQDDDGCPEATAAIEVVGNQIRIRDGFAINFDPARDSVMDSSRPVLDAIAALLRNPAYSWIRRIRLEGHTDDVGETAANLDLSQRRVRRVGALLVANGVPTDRLTFESYGESRPIDPSGTEEARARNRRVEMFIIDPATFGGVRATN